MEQNYVFYDASGNIIQWGVMAEDLIRLNAEQQQVRYILGSGHPSDSYVDVETHTIRRKQPSDTNL